MSENCLTKIDGLSQLPTLTTVNIARNRLETAESIQHMAECPSITNLDISHNQLEDPSVLNVFSQMPKLKALRIEGNPVVSKTKQFRRTYLSQLTQLAYLDRPVFEKERLAVNAWKEGGAEAEKEARLSFVDRERQQHRKDMQDFRDWQNTIREKKMIELKRRQANGEKVGYFDIDTDGTLRATTQYYDRLSLEEREKWDKRSEQAHRDAQEEREKVQGDGITALGKEFWAMTNQTETDSTIAEAGSTITHDDSILEEEEEDQTTGKEDFDSTASEAGSSDSTADEEEKIRQLDEISITLQDEERIDAEPIIPNELQPPAAPIERLSWQQLSSQATGAQPMVIPDMLPSMMDNPEDSDDDDDENLRILSRQDILRQISHKKM